MNETHVGRQLSVRDLPLMAAGVARRAGLPLAIGEESPGLVIRSIRLKPGRGLTALLVRGRARSRAGAGLSSITVGANSLDGARLRFSLPELDRARLETPAPGIASAPGLAVSVQVFPADAGLPALAECLGTECDGSLVSILQSAAQAQVDDHRLTVTAARAEPLRYKIGSRCVVVYQLRGGDGRCSFLVGKVYADAAKALYLYRNLDRLHRHFRDGGPSIPRPLALSERLGLVLTTAFTADDGGATAGPRGAQRLGQTWRPEFNQPCGSTLSRTDRIALRLAGRSIAELHSAPTDRLELRLRDGATEANVVMDRTLRLMASHPELATHLQRLGERVAERLKVCVPADRVVAHGGFKRSQLVWAADRVHLVDFDGLCLADPALDIGCFLAYLRPHRMYVRRRDDREWFEAAADEFLAAYREGAVALGRRAEALPDLCERAWLYEASHLFKIATRRLNRLNSQRQAEISAICEEIAGCISRPRSRS